MRQPDRRQVLGGHLGRAWHRPDGQLPRRLGPAAGAHQCLLQRGVGRQVCAARCTRRFGARHHGLSALGSVRSDLSAGQLRVRPVGRGQQLGQGPLHRGRRARRLDTRGGAQGGRVVRLLAGLSAGALARRRHRLITCMSDRSETEIGGRRQHRRRRHVCMLYRRCRVAPSKSLAS